MAKGKVWTRERLEKQIRLKLKEQKKEGNGTNGIQERDKSNNR